MGSGRDKRKKQKGKQPGVGASKTEKKTALNATKEQRRAERSAAGGEDDLDAMLAQFQLADKRRTTVQVLSDAPPPSPRGFASFTPVLNQKDRDIVLFGGEYYDGKADKVRCYDDLFFYSPNKDRWTQVISPGGPAPRSSHQAAVHRGCLYIFGGELMSPNQENFKHYRDLWRLDLGSHAWELMPGKGGPSGRSGHRMALYKHKLSVFGGFNDSGKACQYYNDLWEYDLEELRWSAVSPNSAARPSPRGGCQIVVAGDTLFLFGGHSVNADPADKSETETVHDDIWALDLSSYQWERVKKAGMAPSPRTSFGMAAHRQRAVLFGGITDRAGAGDKLYSDLHDELYQFNFASRRWFPLALRARRPAPGQATGGGTAGAEPSAAPSGASAAAPEPGASPAAPELNAERQAGAGPSASAASSSPAPPPPAAAGPAAPSTRPGPSGDVAEGPAAGRSAAAGPAGAPAAAAAGGALGEGAQREDLPEFLERGGFGRGTALYEAAVRIQARYRGYAVRKAYKTYKLGGPVSELLYSPAAYGIDFAARDAPRPRARANPMLAVCGNTLWLLGGVVEVAHTDVTLDDLWALDLAKLDGWRCVRANTAGEDAFRDDSSGWEEAGEEGDEAEDSESE